MAAVRRFCEWVLESILLEFWVVARFAGGSAEPRAMAAALIIFGDSTVDPGNNNKVITLIRSDFPPYGRDFYEQRPTGRFCNGKIVTDYIASSLRLKDLLPAYLDPQVSPHDLITGVSFASAGSGYDNVTATILSVIPLWKQLQFFKSYRNQVTSLVGKERAKRILSEAIYGISMGSNDFVNNYFINPVRKAQFSLPQYQDFLVGIARSFLEEIYINGARRIAVIGLPPLGCLPSVITLRAGGHRQDCIQEYNVASTGFNQKLTSMVQSLDLQLPGARILYCDIYEIFFDMVQFPARYGFQQAREGCCGTGLVEVAVLCNRKAPYTCMNASEYVFWDSFHPTQSAYQVIAQHLIETDLKQLL